MTCWSRTEIPREVGFSWSQDWEAVKDPLHASRFVGNAVQVPVLSSLDQPATDHWWSRNHVVTFHRLFLIAILICVDLGAKLLQWGSNFSQFVDLVKTVINSKAPVVTILFIEYNFFRIVWHSTSYLNMPISFRHVFLLLFCHSLRQIRVQLNISYDGGTIRYIEKWEIIYLTGLILPINYVREKNNSH